MLARHVFSEVLECPRAARAVPVFMRSQPAMVSFCRHGKPTAPTSRIDYTEIFVEIHAATCCEVMFMFARTSASARGGHTLFPQRATCAVFVNGLP